MWEILLNEILEKYDPKEIYNTDITGIFYKDHPDCGYAHVSKKLEGETSDRQRECPVEGYHE